MAKASDWWSVGVILLELLTGKQMLAVLDAAAEVDFKVMYGTLCN